MNINTIVCTRDAKKVTNTFIELIGFYSSCNINTRVVSGASSIFKAYHNAFTALDPADDDIIILCHDDIAIKEDPKMFVSRLQSELSKPNTGFVGPAGTRYLSPNAVWWDQEVWKQGLHRGEVKHYDKKGKMYATTYGPPGPVVVLDGLFLAATAKTLKDIGLTKPDYFTGEWDFYDLHYTMSAHQKGYTNRVMDMNIIHNSRGELVGRDSWHENRQAFIEHTQLPVQAREQKTEKA